MALRGPNPNTTGTTSSTSIDRLSGELGHVRLGGEHHHQNQEQADSSMDDLNRWVDMMHCERLVEGSAGLLPFFWPSG